MTRQKTIDPQRIEAPDPEMVRVLRQKSGAERFRIAVGMVAAARRMLRSSLAAKHPGWDDERLDREVARRLAGGAGTLLAPSASNADCHEDYNSTRTYTYGYGYACAGYGGTCTECTSSGDGSCVFDGSGSCAPTEEHQY